MEQNIIEHNPMLKVPLMTILRLFEDAGTLSRSVVEQQASQVWEERFHVSGPTAIDVLVRNGYIAEQLFVDGEPYDGTLEDLQTDEHVADDAQAERMLQITQEARDLYAAYVPEATMRALMSEKPHYRDVFEGALKACANGATRDALEAAINTFPQLAPDAQSGQTKVYPQYFIDALETAGGIRWDGAWRITEAGKGALAASV